MKQNKPKVNFTFSRRAAERWDERCSKFDFNSEMCEIRRDEQAEMDLFILGVDNHRVYTTKSGIILIAVNAIVTTVIYKLTPNQAKLNRKAKSLTPKN